jgi:hypothetical protein
MRAALSARQEKIGDIQIGMQEQEATPPPTRLSLPELPIQVDHWEAMKWDGK